MSKPTDSSKQRASVSNAALKQRMKGYNVEVA